MAFNFVMAAEAKQNLFPIKEQVQTCGLVSHTLHFEQMPSIAAWFERFVNEFAVCDLVFDSRTTA